MANLRAIDHITSTTEIFIFTKSETSLQIVWLTFGFIVSIDDNTDESIKFVKVRFETSVPNIAISLSFLDFENAKLLDIRHIPNPYVNDRHQICMLYNIDSTNLVVFFDSLCRP